jgi:heme/copper-type cytochrome/quinol oxidase subunit 1
MMMIGVLTVGNFCSAALDQHYVCVVMYSVSYIIFINYIVYTHIACLRCPMCLKAASTTWDAVVSVAFWMIGHGIVAVLQPFATEATLDCLWSVNVL